VTFIPSINQYNSAGRIIAPVFGNVSLYDGEPPYWIEEVDARVRTDPQALRRQPSRLLHAQHRFIEFTGRSDEVHLLRRWRDSPIPVRVMLVHAPGGHGKTRLALEFTEDSARAGWRTWHARHAHDPAERGTAVYAVGASGGRHLVVADYADRWSHRALHALCASAASDPGEGVRLLLMSRTLRGWWALRGELDDLEVDYTDLHLQPIEAPGRRGALFEAAKSQFAELFEVPLERTGPTPRSIDSEQYASVLAVHMAALAAVPTEDELDRPPEEIEEVAAFLLAREIRNWERLRVAGRDFLSGYRALTQAVFTAVLTGPHADYRDARGALGRTGIGDNLDQLLDDHRALYPPADGRYSLEPLYPDRLAEDFLGLLTPGHGVSFHTNPWAAIAPTDLLRRRTGEEPFAYTAQALIFLTAASSRWPHLAQTLTRVLQTDPALAVLGGGAALHAIAAVPGLDVETLEQVAEHLPSKISLDLAPGAEAIISAITDRHLSKPESSPTDRAYLLWEVAQRRFRIGDFQGSDEAVSAAIAYLRLLADEYPQRHIASLSSALALYAQTLGSRLHFDQAVTTINEAEQLSRRYQEPMGELNPSHLVQILSIKSAVLQGAGRIDDARAAAEEVDAMLVALPGGEPVHVATMASAAVTRALALRAQGRLEEALTEIREACARFERERSEDDEDSLVSLTKMLFNYGAIAGEAGHYEEAHEPLTRVVELCEMLEPRSPGVFASIRRSAELNLKHISNALSKPGAEGTLGTEGTFTFNIPSELLQRSFDKAADTGGPDSTDPIEAFDLVEKADEATSEGRLSEAQPLLERAVDITERLYLVDQSKDVESLLALASIKIAVLHHDRGEWRAAVPNARRAVELLRKLHRLDREHLSEFCVSLFLLSECLDHTGRTHEARVIRAELNSTKPFDMEWPY
jgi:tetratricopeptide (TPR) repeat protein